MAPAVSVARSSSQDGAKRRTILRHRVRLPLSKTVHVIRDLRTHYIPSLEVVVEDSDGGGLP